MTRRASGVLVAALFVALAEPSQASELASLGAPSIRVFGVDEGLPQSTVNVITIDASGRLWIGTQGGAAYHDGQRFISFPLPTEGGASWVQALHAEPDGAVWFGMVDGAAFRYAGGSFQRFGASEGLTSASPVRAIRGMDTSDKRAVWVGTMDGLYRFEDGRFHRVELGPKLPHPDIPAMLTGTLPSGEPTLWMRVNHGGLWHCEEKRCSPFKAEGDEVLGNGSPALLQTKGEGGRFELWAGLNPGIARYADGRWEVITPASFERSPVWALAETIDGSGERTLWAGTYGGGLARFSKGKWSTLTVANSGLLDNYVLSLAATGRTLWLGTNAGGLARLRHDAWTAFTPRNSPFSATVIGLCEMQSADGRSEIWFGSDNRLLRLSENGFSHVLSPADEGKLGTMLTALLPSRREPGVVFIGAFVTGLFRLEAGELKHYDAKNARSSGTPSTI